LLATVGSAGANPRDPIHFEFQEVTEAVVPGDTAQRFGADFIHRCYQENAQN
jgi:hypothetical protein